ncbi:MAG: hypothetical protein M4D80_02380 [Myxococcota bacterium]|nr:hypothetical protein [Deltaproteobacteria bacterium]MDQ3333980.1 hypothetical protein [Myxococcota bacterium]
MANDDDIFSSSSSVPDPDAEPTASERAHAKTFADLVDKTLAGRTPPAVSADDRALLEVATVIRAATGNVTLSAGKQRSIVEDALRQAIGGGPATSMPGVTPITAARRRWVPWAIATGSSIVAAAAIAMLWFRAPSTNGAPVAAAATPTTWTSRPADSLIGPIDRERAGDASARIDTIFADRMDGYRDRRLSRGGKR